MSRTQTKLRSVAMILLSSRWWRLSLLHHLVDQPQSSQLHINTAVNLHNLHILSCKSSLAWEHRCGRLSLYLQLWWRKQKKRGGGVTCHARLLVTVATWDGPLCETDPSHPIMQSCRECVCSQVWSERGGLTTWYHDNWTERRQNGTGPSWRQSVRWRPSSVHEFRQKTSLQVRSETDGHSLDVVTKSVDVSPLTRRIRTGILSTKPADLFI